jgi:hypothetical protein
MRFLPYVPPSEHPASGTHQLSRYEADAATLTSAAVRAR